MRKDFSLGSISRKSAARTNILFTADRRIIAYSAGSLQQRKVEEIVQKTVTVLTA